MEPFRKGLTGVGTGCRTCRLSSSLSVPRAQPGPLHVPLGSCSNTSRECGISKDIFLTHQPVKRVCWHFLVSNNASSCTVIPTHQTTPCSHKTANRKAPSSLVTATLTLTEIGKQRMKVGPLFWKGLWSSQDFLFTGQRWFFEFPWILHTAVMQDPY